MSQERYKHEQVRTKRIDIRNVRDEVCWQSRTPTLILNNFNGFEFFKKRIIAQMLNRRHVIESHVLTHTECL